MVSSWLIVVWSLQLAANYPKEPGVLSRLIRINALIPMILCLGLWNPPHAADMPWLQHHNNQAHERVSGRHDCGNRDWVMVTESPRNGNGWANGCNVRQLANLQRQKSSQRPNATALIGKTMIAEKQRLRPWECPKSHQHTSQRMKWMKVGTILVWVRNVPIMDGYAPYILCAKIKGCCTQCPSMTMAGARIEGGELGSEQTFCNWRKWIRLVMSCHPRVSAV
jgi:hypothetical protein